MTSKRSSPRVRNAHAERLSPRPGALSPRPVPPVPAPSASYRAVLAHRPFLDLWLAQIRRVGVYLVRASLIRSGAVMSAGEGGAS
jgi:hypothetical protein